jgi:hypothetical protein
MSYADTDRVIAAAARKGVDELRAVTKINWKLF